MLTTLLSKKKLAEVPQVPSKIKQMNFCIDQLKWLSHKWNTSIYHISLHPSKLTKSSLHNVLKPLTHQPIKIHDLIRSHVHNKKTNILIKFMKKMYMQKVLNENVTTQPLILNILFTKSLIPGTIETPWISLKGLLGFWLKQNKRQEWKNLLLQNECLYILNLFVTIKSKLTTVPKWIKKFNVFLTLNSPEIITKKKEMPEGYHTTIPKVIKIMKYKILKNRFYFQPLFSSTYLLDLLKQNVLVYHKTLKSLFQKQTNFFWLKKFNSTQKHFFKLKHILLQFYFPILLNFNQTKLILKHWHILYANLSTILTLKSLGNYGVTSSFTPKKLAFFLKHLIYTTLKKIGPESKVNLSLLHTDKQKSLLETGVKLQTKNSLKRHTSKIHDKLSMFCTSIRNAILCKNKIVLLPGSIYNYNLTKLLYSINLIQTFKWITKGNFIGFIVINLSYEGKNRTSLFQSLHQLSTVSYHETSSIKNFNSIWKRFKSGHIFISTIKGIMPLTKAKTWNLGGELLFLIK